MGIRGVDSSFRLIAPREKRDETQHYWFEIRVRWSQKMGEEYFDVLIGKKGEENVHAHIGIRRDQSVLFEEPRGFLRTLSRTIDSKKMGRLADETKVYDKKKSEGARFTFKFIIDDPTKTIRLVIGEAPLKE